MDFSSLNPIQIASYKLSARKLSDDFIYSESSRSFLHRTPLKIGKRIVAYSTTKISEKELDEMPNLIVEGKQVFERPFIALRMSNNDTHVQHFEQDHEIGEFLKEKDGLGLIKWVEIKT